VSPAAIALIALAVPALQLLLLLPARGFLRRRGVSWTVTGWLSAAVLGAAVSLWILFRRFDLDLEHHADLMWAWLCVSVLVAGVVCAARTRRMPIWDLGLAMLLVLEAAAVLAFARADSEGLAGPAARALLVAPVTLGLCAYFGVSVGYLLWGGSGRVDLRLGYESLVGRRFLLNKASPVLSTVTAISVVGVSLGVWLVLVALGVLAGFENDLQRKIIGANAHVVLQTKDASPFDVDEAAVRRLSTTGGASAASPFAEGEVALASHTNFTGALLFGVDPERAPHVLSVLAEISQGSLQPLVDEMRPAPAEQELHDADLEFPPPAPIANIVIGVEMAKTLNVQEGDKIRALSPVLEVLTPVGMAPKSVSFRVAGIFSSKMYEYDARYAYVSLRAARRFFELGERAASGIHLATPDPDWSDRVGRVAAASLGDRFEALDWKRRNQTLFSALKLERVVAFVVLVFIILVASFSIVNTLAMSVIEKRKEIAILKTMGARDVGVMKLFLVQGLVVGAFGTFFGAAMAVATVWLLKRFGFWIPGEVYYIDALPVNLELGDVVLVVLAALLIVWDFSVFPALRGSRLEPVEGLRDG
jgi:lipoprotein-releasing system permease protein